MQLTQLDRIEAKLDLLMGTIIYIAHSDLSHAHDNMIQYSSLFHAHSSELLNKFKEERLMQEEVSNAD
jgi:hypothetical protein